ncbi:DoxX family protein [Hymenobacter jeollabukensis]|uniref:DoxX family protein n=1 Tax=Hymenobacter jeollabukensis TaxID=2025313 RepID=A0A5R8WVN1_9BACT|nr:DoxX family protein [Hymenobacter jeollabukensis]TLM96581.1 DoxX family protein [Hymenobacter jeollabukensis]
MPLLENRYRYADLGLLLLRLGLGVMMVVHGYPKLMGGPEKWTALGGEMRHLGINFAPAAWGLAAAIAETIGGQLLALGLLFRWACGALLITMLVAAVSHLAVGEGFGDYSHALENGIVFLGLLLIGPGKYSVDQQVFPPSRKRY